MRIAVLADIHSNVLALDAVLANLAGRKPDLIVDLGDCVSGPLWPRATFERLAELDILPVRGNHDRWLATRDLASLGNWDRLAFAELSAEQRATLGDRPANVVVAPGIFACHGTPTRDDLYLLDEIEDDRVVRSPREGILERLGKVEARLVLCAHSHRADLVRIPGGPTILNPGSVGCPAFESTSGTVEAGSPDARYAMIEVGAEGQFVFEHIAVPYDHEAAARQAEANGRPEWAYPLRTGFVPPPA
jgi:predicted phosphodiesterase